MAAWSWLRVSEVAVNMSAGAAVSEGLPGAGGSSPKTAYAHGCWQQVSVPYLVGLSIALLTTCDLPSGISDPEGA